MWFACDGLKKLLGSSSDDDSADKRDIAIIIAAEHVIFIFKIYLAAVIPDVPNYIQERADIRDFKKKTEKLKLKSQALEQSLRRKAAAKKNFLNLQVAKHKDTALSLSPMKLHRGDKIEIDLTGSELEKPMFQHAFSLIDTLKQIEEDPKGENVVSDVKAEGKGWDNWDDQPAPVKSGLTKPKAGNGDWNINNDKPEESEKNELPTVEGGSIGRADSLGGDSEKESLKKIQETWSDGSPKGGEAVKNFVSGGQQDPVAGDP